MKKFSTLILALAFLSCCSLSQGVQPPRQYTKNSLVSLNVFQLFNIAPQTGYSFSTDQVAYSGIQLERLQKSDEINSSLSDDTCTKAKTYTTGGKFNIFLLCGNNVNVSPYNPETQTYTDTNNNLTTTGKVAWDAIQDGPTLVAASNNNDEESGNNTLVFDFKPSVGGEVASIVVDMKTKMATPFTGRVSMAPFAYTLGTGDGAQDTNAYFAYQKAASGDDKNASLDVAYVTTFTPSGGSGTS